MAAPEVSVVIPSFGRPEPLRRCLAALSRQDHPSTRLEVIVVDDGSPEPLGPLVADLADGMRLRVHRQGNAGPAAARNTGLEVAGGEVVAFTDDDCEPDPSWVRRMSARVIEDRRSLVGGRVVNALHGNVFAEASQQLVDFLYGWYGDEATGAFFTSNNMAAARAELIEIGRFDQSFPQPGGEDRELCERWQRSGRPLVYVDDARVEHAHSLDLRSFVRQHRNYGNGAYQVHRRRADVEGRPLRVEPLRFYASLVVHPFGKSPLRRASAVSALLVLAQAVNALGFFEELVAARLDRRRS